MYLFAESTDEAEGEECKSKDKVAIRIDYKDN